MKVRFSVFTKKTGILTKKITVDKDGKLSKDSSMCRMAEGWCVTREVDFSDFGKTVSGLSSNQAIAHGICEQSAVEITSRRRGGEGTTRTKDKFEYPKENGILMLDVDDCEVDVETILRTVIDGYDGLAKTITHSTSSWIYKDDELVRGGTGKHIYLVVEDGRNVPATLDVIFKRLIINGHGFVKITSCGSVLIRTIVDKVVASPERLDFVAGAVCEGCEQRLPAPVYTDGAAIGRLEWTVEEEKKYAKIVDELKKEAGGKAAEVRSAYISEETDKLVLAGRDREEAKKAVNSRVGNIINVNDILYFEFLREGTRAGEVLENQSTFDGENLRDPLEPERKDGSYTKAIFYWNDGNPAIYSHIHGGKLYTFEKQKKKRDEMYPPETIKLLKEFNERYAACLIGGKFRICSEVAQEQMGGFSEYVFTEREAWAGYHMNLKCQVFEGKNTRTVPITKAWLEWPERKSYDRVVFAPGGNDRKETLNLWRGLAVEPKEGDWGLFAGHMYKYICGEDEQAFRYLTAWMADLVQHPGGQKNGVAVVLRGAKGTGKGIFANMFGRIFGGAYMPISSPDGLTGRFNSHLAKCVLVFADEATWGGSHDGDNKLKAIITEPTLDYEPKGIDRMSMPNHVRVIIASNEAWVVKVSEEERRYLIFDMKDAGNGRSREEKRAYYDALMSQMNNGGLEAMLFDLLRHDYSDISIRDAPRTQGFREQLAQNLPPVARFWQTVMARGYLLTDYRDKKPVTSVLGGGYWPEKALCHEIYTEFCNQQQISRAWVIAERTFWAESEALHPCLVKKRVRMGEDRLPMVWLPKLVDEQDE